MLLLLCAPALVALLLTLANALSWPRGRSAAGARRPSDASTGASSTASTWSVLIPARNEGANIEACVRAALVLGPLEVVVFDDGSTDDTSAILARLVREQHALRLAGEGPSTTLRVLHGDGVLPAGWVGKVHACARLAAAARGDALLFLDADVRVHADAAEHLRSFVEQQRADVVTAVPRQLTGTWGERLVMPMLHVTYASWLWLPLVWRSQDPRFIAANGQVLWLTRAALARIGGFAAIRNEIVDDMALCRRAKTAGLRVVFADAHTWARCRMYRSLSEVVAGFSKNLREGVGSSIGVVAVMGLYAWAFLAPLAALVVAAVATQRGLHVERELLAAGALGVASHVVQRSVLAVRHTHAWSSVLLYPLGVVAFLVIALNSLRWRWRGRIAWKGRTYAATRNELPSTQGAPPSATNALEGTS